MDHVNIANQLLEIFCGLVTDVEEILQLGKHSLHCDLDKVTVSLKSRGVSLFMVDFPSLCSSLESSLESGDWKPMLGKPFFRKNGPTIFRPLFAKIFEESGVVRCEPCADSIRCLRQMLKFAKKFRLDCPKSAVAEKYREFADIEAQLIPPVLSWGSDLLVCTGGYPTFVDLGHRLHKVAGGLGGTDDTEATSRVLRTLAHIQSICDGFTRHFKFQREWFTPKHGPGAVSEPYEFSKYEFPSWPDRLEAKFPFDLFGLVNHQNWGGEVPTSSSRPAKLIDVPKDYRGPRLIASEPISSQFVQQGIMNVIRQNLKRSALRHSIDFKSQEPSRELALASSATREFSTIDLSSASDRLSCAVVECVFRRNYSFLEILNAARTPEILYPDGSVERLKKFAAQGAAFTFPVQSIVYALICCGVIYAMTGESRLSVLSRQVRVYGDDMIVPSDFYPAICEILEVLQLRVNLKKSFSKGFFRESCGMDAFAGTDVTSASVLTYYLKQDPNTLVSTVECANNLYQKGFINASRILLETIPRRHLRRLAVRDSVSTVFGILGTGPNPCLRRRWNSNLHRSETQILVVENKVTRTTPDGHSHLFQWFVERPRPDVIWESGEIASVKARYCLRWVASHNVRYSST